MNVAANTSNDGVYLLALGKVHAISRVMLLFLLLAAVQTSSAQEFDLLPDIVASPFVVRATIVTSGLPVQNEMVTEVFTQRVGPTDLAVIPDGSGDVVVSAYGGTAHRIDSSGNVDPQLFLDLVNESSPSYSTNFDIGGAHGFTSIAFHPNFSTAGSPGYGKFYTIESEVIDSGTPDFVTSTEMTRHHDDAVYEYTLADPSQRFCDSACAESKREIMRVLQPGWHHNLGDLLFDQDGLLFIASADGSTSRPFEPFMSDNSQQLETVFGNILRIDPLGTDGRNGQYGIPSTNPFVDTDGVLEEIYAFGFRNPYRLDMDLETGDVYTTDTGERRIESAYKVQAGGNHGWNLKEGSFVYDKVTKLVAPDVDSDGSGIGDVAEDNDLVEPIFEYDRDFGRSIIGTVLNRDPELAYLGETLVFGDFTGRLYYGDLATGEEFEFQFTDDSDRLPLQIHSVNFAADGEIRVLGIQRSSEGFEGIIVGLEPCFGDAIPGDFNTDGEVSFSDFLILSQHFGESDRTFAEGDATCDSEVRFEDFLVLARNFGREEAAAVPEPGGTLMIGLSILCLMQSRLSLRERT